jgi:O-antigen ligase
MLEWAREHMKALTMDQPKQRQTLVVLALLILHGAAALMFFVDPRLAFALLLAAVGVVVALEKPLWAVGLLIAGRLTSTGANAWVRLGGINIDLFEPALLLCVAAIGLRAALYKEPLGRSIPWMRPVVALLLFQILSLAWTGDLGETTGGILATLVLLATVSVIVHVVNTWERFRFMIWVWLATSSFVALASVLGVFTGYETQAQFEMAQGSREGGFGQHPNWFAMNLCFIVHVALAMALTERRRALRWLALAAGILIVIAQMRSGSRAGSGTLVLGALFAAFGYPAYRKQMIRVGVLIGIILGLVMLSDVSSTQRAFERVFTLTSSISGKSIRFSNWEVCWQLLWDTRGLGISGGYSELLAKYDSWLYASQYRYPHGVFWGLMANFGVVGLTLYGWFLVSVMRMVAQTIGATRGHPQHAVVWGMVASMLGYWTWSFVEFSFDEKPFWEFLALFTVCWLLSQQRPEQTIKDSS